MNHNRRRDRKKKEEGLEQSSAQGARSRPQDNGGPSVAVWIPGPPGFKARGIPTGSRRKPVKTDPRTAAAEKSAADVFLLEMRDRPGPHLGPVKLEVRAYFARPKSVTEPGPHLRAPDGSNILKAVEDAGNRILWKDDRQIFDTRCLKFWTPLAEEEGIEVRAWFR